VVLSFAVACGRPAPATKLLRFPDVWHDRTSSAMRRFVDRRDAGRYGDRPHIESGYRLFGKFSPDGR